MHSSRHNDAMQSQDPRSHHYGQAAHGQSHQGEVRHGPKGHERPGAGYAPGTYVDPRAQLSSGVTAFMTGVFGWMTVGIALTATIILLLTTVARPVLALFYTPEGYMTGLGMVAAFAPLLFVFLITSRMETMSQRGARISFLVFSGLFGIALADLPLMYNLPSLGGTFVATTMMFGSVAAYGYFTKKDLSGWGTFLFMAMFGLMFAFIASAIFGFGSMLLSVLFVLLFAGLTAYKTQTIKQIYLVQGRQGNLEVMGALTLYISFINMFVWVLHLFGSRR